MRSEEVCVPRSEPLQVAPLALLEHAKYRNTLGGGWSLEIGAMTRIRVHMLLHTCGRALHRSLRGKIRRIVTAN